MYLAFKDFNLQIERYYLLVIPMNNFKLNCNTVTEYTMV